MKTDRRCLPITYYRREGKKIEEKAGRQIEDAMTPARENAHRVDRISGKSLPNAERRAVRRWEENEATWTLSRLLEEYNANKLPTKSIATDDNLFKKHILPVLGYKQFKEPASLPAKNSNEEKELCRYTSPDDAIEIFNL